MHPPRTVTADTRSGKFTQTLQVGPHTLVADEHREDGGEDLGPAPFELLAAGLAACTSMTVKAYADHKGISLRRVHVEVTVVRDADRTTFEKVLRFEGNLEDAERDRLVEISKRCPVHRTLMGAITLETRLI